MFASSQMAACTYIRCYSEGSHLQANEIPCLAFTFSGLQSPSLSTTRKQFLRAFAVFVKLLMDVQVMFILIVSKIQDPESWRIMKERRLMCMQGCKCHGVKIYVWSFHLSIFLLFSVCVFILFRCQIAVDFSLIKKEGVCVELCMALHISIFG